MRKLRTSLREYSATTGYTGLVRAELGTDHWVSWCVYTFIALFQKKETIGEPSEEHAQPIHFQI